MSHKLIGIALMLALIENFAGCISLTSIPTSASFSFVTLEQGHYSGVQESLERVIQTYKEWKIFWEQHQSGVVRQQPVQINFPHVSAIAVFVGGRSDGRYSVEITSVVREKNHITVTYQEVIAEGNCKYIAAATHPYHIVLTLLNKVMVVE